MDTFNPTIGSLQSLVSEIKKVDMEDDFDRYSDLREELESLCTSEGLNFLEFVTNILPKEKALAMINHEVKPTVKELNELLNVFTNASEKAKTGDISIDEFTAKMAKVAKEGMSLYFEFFHIMGNLNFTEKDITGVFNEHCSRYNPEQAYEIIEFAKFTQDLQRARRLYQQQIKQGNVNLAYLQELWVDIWKFTRGFYSLELPIEYFEVTDDEAERFYCLFNQNRLAS